MKQPLTLAQWLCAPRPDDIPVAWQEDHTWTLGHLRHDVAQLITQLQRWKVNAGHYAGKLFIHRRVAGNAPCWQNTGDPGTLSRLVVKREHLLFDGVWSDKALDWQGTLRVVSSAMTSVAHDITFPIIRSDAFVELFTSGSSRASRNA